MAMNIGTTSTGETDLDVMVDINTTPLIDVMLVLLIMLIITIPIQLHAVNLNMPVGTPPPTEIKPEIIRIDIDDKSVVHWQGVPIAGPAELERMMKAAAAQPTQPEIHLRPNRFAKYEVVANVLASTKRLGLTKIGVVGSEQFVE
jgi:biopolymer transport protein ExbD